MVKTSLRKKMVVAVILSGTLLTAVVTGQVKISEFLANNVSVNPDNWDFEDFSDWIELHNEGSTEADIGGYYLTGDLKQPKKWQFPSDATIPANGYLLIWADGHNGKPGQKETREWYPWNEQYTLKSYHAVFKLDKAGEQVGLFNASGVLVDSVTFGKQFADVSMGRKADGTWAFFDEPTPAQANSTAAKPLTTASLAGEVTFSVEGGMYSSAQTVTLTASDGSDIYYTTDGSIPYASDTKYASPVAVSTTTIIRARAISPDKIAGKVTTNTYFISEKARSVMVVSLATDPGFLNDKTYGIWANSMKGREIPVSLEFFTTDGKRAVRCNAGVRNGTLTSFAERQHPLQVALRSRYGDESVNYKFFSKDITKFDRFRLRQGGDVWSTNFIGDALLDPINEKQTVLGYQAFRPTVVFVNGTYYGLMNLREQFKESFFAENFGVDGTKRDDVRSILQPAGKGGLLSSYQEGWEILAGTWDAYRSLIASVKAGTVDASVYAQVKQQVDFASMVDFFCMIHFGDAVSWGHNQELWRVPDGKWKWLITDFDRAWTYGDGGLMSMGGVTHNLFTSGAGSSPSLIPGDTLLAKLLNNSEFRNYFAQRYAAHLNSTLKPSRLTGIVDSIAGLITGEMDDHTKKWGSQGGIKSTTAWKAEVTDIKKFMAERSANVWEFLAAKPIGISQDRANLTVAISPSEAQADIFVSGVRMSQGLSAISLFTGIAFGVKAVGKPGWIFDGWDGGTREDSMMVTLDGNKTITAKFIKTDVAILQSTIPEHPGFQCLDRITSKNGRMTLQLTVTSGTIEHLCITLYDILGRKMAMLFDADVIPGNRRVIDIPMDQFAPGIYFRRLQTGSFDKTERIGIR